MFSASSQTFTSFTANSFTSNRTTRARPPHTRRVAGQGRARAGWARGPIMHFQLEWRRVPQCAASNTYYPTECTTPLLHRDTALVRTSLPSCRVASTLAPMSFCKAFPHNQKPLVPLPPDRNTWTRPQSVGRWWFSPAADESVFRPSLWYGA